MERHPGQLVDLRGLRCKNAQCPDRRRLVPDREPGWVRCEACGVRWGGGDLFRPYAQVTGGLIVSSAVMLSYGWTHEAGPQRWSLLGVAAVQAAIVGWRLVYQSRTLRRLRAPR